MPLSYADGTLAEHRACRSGAVAFDVSHLGTVRVGGRRRARRASSARSPTTWARSARAGPSTPTCSTRPMRRCSTTSSCGGSTTDEFHVMPNASNTEPGASTRHRRRRRHRRRGRCIAVQGPEARRRAGRRGARRGRGGPLRGAPRSTWKDAPCIVAGTGYTGEDGVECAVPGRRRRRVLAGGARRRRPPAGLGARDTLRLEAGLPLHGHELGPGITPLQAGLGWVVGWDKGDFRGRGAARGRARAGRRPGCLRGLTVDGRQPPRTGSEVLVDGTVVGDVTSGNFSPVLGHGIALGFRAARARARRRGRGRRAGPAPPRPRSSAHRS